MAEDGYSKLDSLSKEDLIKLVKKYVVLQKTLKNKNEELNNKIKSYDENKTDKVDNSLTEANIKLEELNKQNIEYANENSNLKSKIEVMNQEINSLKENIKEHEDFRSNLVPQLENARKEIELNKSMLIMLNNEINVINQEKNQLEKRLLNNRRLKTPSVIIEEEEEDLEEEQHNKDDQNLDKEIDRIDNDKDVEFIMKNSKDTDGIIILNKQIEEMTFYIDELKSELEAEREKNVEISNELIKNRNELENLKTNLTVPNCNDVNQNSKFENGEDSSINIADDINKDDSTQISPNQLINNESEDDVNEMLHIKLKTVLKILIDELIDSENYESSLKSLKNVYYNDELNNLYDELVEKYRLSIEKRENISKSKSDRLSYVETQMEKVIKDYKIEIEDFQNQINSKDNELQNYKIDSDKKLKSIQIELDNEKEKNKSLERLQKEASKSKMLDLEIADYEKTIKALNLQLITKEKELNDAKQDLSTTNDKMNKLKEDLQNLEKEKDIVDEKNTKLKQLLVKAKKDVSDAKAHEAQHLSADVSMKAQIESQSLEIENYKLQISDLSFEKQKLQEKLQSIGENGQKTIQLLESKKKNLEEDLKDSNNKIQELRDEFENYKIKVQHAFKKQKEKNETSSSNSAINEIEKYLNEIDSLKLVIVKLTDELKESNEKFSVLEKEFDILQDEYTKCLDRNTSLLAELKEKESEWKTKNQELLKENSMKSNEAIDIIRDLKSQNEAQQLDFKERIKQIRSQNCQSIDLLQTQLEESKKEITRLNKQIDELKQVSKTPLTPNGSFHSNPIQFNNHISSSTDDSIKNNFILGNLENGDILNDKQSETNKTKAIEQLLLLESPTIDNILPTKPSEFLKNDLNKAKIQLEHLNELLNESELNNVRLTEQINVLKEEIRRLERNQEREKSISNMEYLKNVVLKFLSFSSLQEKEQLLPVLTTMLKLDKEEQNLIMNAKVKLGNEAGWSNYLPKWSS